MKQVGKGAEAIVFKRKRGLVKKRLRKAYRHAQLDERLRSERTRKETRILSRANASSVSTPKLLESNEKRKEIVFSEIKGRQAKVAKLSPGILKKIGFQLALLHNAGISHGDFTTSNVMISKGKAFLIDFGFGEFTTSVEQFATDLVLFQKTVSAEQFGWFLKGYSSKADNACAVVERMHAINQRGRYVERG